MDTLLVVSAAEKLGICQERIFGLAFCYAERRCSQRIVVNAYNNWYWNGIICDEVEDFVIDVLANRVEKEEIPNDYLRKKS